MSHFFLEYALLAISGAQSIIQGEFTKAGEFPFSVVILRNGRTHCGGVIFSYKTVATCCHCVGEFGNLTVEDSSNFNYTSLDSLLFVAGTEWVYTFGIGQSRKSAYSTRHPNCQRRPQGQWSYDYGIFHLVLPFLESPTVKKMQLHHESQRVMEISVIQFIKYGLVCTVIGWGFTEIDESGQPAVPTETQRKTEVKLIGYDKCISLMCGYQYDSKCPVVQPEDKLMCAIHVGEGDSCKGDDGNALVCSGYVYGFVSYGEMCFTSKPRLYSTIEGGMDYFRAQASSAVKLTPHISAVLSGL